MTARRVGKPSRMPGINDGSAEIETPFPGFVEYDEKKTGYQGLCNAMKRNGERCRNRAGKKTKHSGFGACWLHGGNSPGHEKKAEVQQVADELMRLGALPDVDPHDAIADAVRLCAGMVTWLRQKVSTLEDSEGEQSLVELDTRTGRLHPSVWTRMLGDWTDRLARVSKGAVDAGVAERQVAIAEEQATWLVTMMDRAFSQLKLSDEQQAAIPQVMMRVMGELEQGQGGGDSE